MSLKQLQTQNMNLRKGIDTYCSKITRGKILRLIGWQFSDSEIKIMDETPSDKEIVESHVNEESPKSL